MHSRILAERNEAALNRLVSASAILAERFNLDEKAEAVASVRERDYQVQALFQREAIADLLEAIVAATEPVPSPAASPAPLPTDLPARAALEKQGQTLAALRAMNREQLIALDDIGPAKAEQILKWLTAHTEDATENNPNEP